MSSWLTSVVAQQFFRAFFSWLEDLLVRWRREQELLETGRARAVLEGSERLREIANEQRDQDRSPPDDDTRLDSLRRGEF